MSKYDFAIDLSDDSSTGIILKKIAPGSTVLEFGCATGRMTRYMKHALDCKVYIVEYEQSAFDEAMNYAEDGVCDDLLTLSWLDKFRDIKFDAVIFADVLEHLLNPVKALRGAEQVLKEDGYIYASIPNITHNDILIKAFYNHFDYTKIGLLDDTHVHFWGLENLKPFMQECGLSVLNLEATYCETGLSEQYAEQSLEISPQLFNYFNERFAGNVYQFVMTLGKSGEAVENIERNLRRPYIKSHIYFDHGDGFNEENVQELQSEMISPGRYSSHYVVDDVSDIKRLRFDPVECQDCILLYVSIRQNGKELATGFNNYIDAEAGKLLLSADPMVYVEINPEEGSVVVDAEILISSVAFEEQLKNLCVKQKQELDVSKEQFATESERFQKEYADLTVQNQKLQREKNEIQDKSIKLQEKINELQEQKEKIQFELDGITGKHEDIQAELEGLQDEHKRILGEFNRVAMENANLRSDIIAYMNLADKKDALLIEKEQNNNFFVKVKRKTYNFLRRIKHKLFRR